MQLVSRIMTRWLLLVSCVLVQGCASSAGVRARPDLITREELIATPGENLLELVQRLRPRWLQSSTPRLSVNTPQTIAVYQDDLNLGGPDALARIPKDNVLAIRLLDPAQAGLLPGIGSQHIEHAIVVQTRREGR